MIPTFSSLFGILIRPWGTTIAQRRSLLRLIVVAAEEQVPLVPLLERWAEDERGVQQMRVYRLVDRLKNGMSLANALEEVRGVLREEDVLAVRFDLQMGTRTLAMRRALAALEPTSPTQSPAMGRVISYLFVMLPLSFLLVTFINLNIVPVFLKMMQQFDIAPPAALQMSYDLARYWWVAAGLILLFLVACTSTDFGRFLRGSFVGRLYSPWRKWLAADVLQKLGVAIEAGRPLPGALSTLARYHFDPSMRSKLLFVRNEVEQGADIWQSLVTVGIVTRPEVRLVQLSDRLGSQPWAIDQLVWARQTRAATQAQQVSRLFMPVAVLALGVFVLVQGLGIFLSLAELMNSQAGPV